MNDDAAIKYLKGRSVKNWLFVFLYALLIFLLSSIPHDSSSFLFSFYMSDKLLHLVEYTILGALLFNAFSDRMSLKKRFVLSFLLASLYGVTDELHQYFVPLRESDPLDLVADSLGGALGSYLSMMFHKGGAVE